jgi:hypothetical protein
MDIMYVQYTHIFKHVKDNMDGGRESAHSYRHTRIGTLVSAHSWHQIMVFTPGVANLNMIVRQSDPGVAGIVAVV